MMRSRPYKPTKTCSGCGETMPTRFAWKEHRCPDPPLFTFDLMPLRESMVRFSAAVEEANRQITAALSEFGENYVRTVNRAMGSGSDFQRTMAEIHRRVGGVRG
jgi:hypothetical protein